MKSQTPFDNPVALILVIVVYVAVVAFMVYLYLRIIQKAGFSGWWVLALFVPVLNLVMLIVFAFAEWPVERRARQAVGSGAYGQVGGSGGFGQPGGSGYGQPGGFGGAASPEDPPRS